MKNIIALLVLLYSMNSFAQTTEKQDDNIYSVDAIDMKPEFPGGLEKFNSLVNETYLKAGFESKIKEKVITLFVIEKDGSLSDIKIVRGFESINTEELIRILKSLPKWNPGKKNGQIVRVLYPLPLLIGK